MLRRGSNENCALDEWKGGGGERVVKMLLCVILGNRHRVFLIILHISSISEKRDQLSFFFNSTSPGAIKVGKCLRCTRENQREKSKWATCASNDLVDVNTMLCCLMTIMIISIKVSILNCSQALNTASITNQSIYLLVIFPSCAAAHRSLRRNQLTLNLCR